MFADLSEKEFKTLEFIAQYIEENGYSPSVREISANVGFKSTSSAHACIKALEEKKYIRKDSAKSRAIEVLSGISSNALNKSETASVPLVGKFSAGEPILAVENIEEYFPVPKEFINENPHFILKISGDSMINAGILNGDYVFIEAVNYAHNGEIVAAMINEEYATIKRFYKEDGHFRLQPENDKYDPIITDKVRIIGRVKMLFRKSI